MSSPRKRHSSLSSRSRSRGRHPTKLTKDGLSKHGNRHHSVSRSRSKESYREPKQKPQVSHATVTKEEVERCEGLMDMKDIRKSEVFLRIMPSSFLINGRRIPKSGLRKHDLCTEYLRYGGKIVRKTRKPLKDWQPPRKPTPEERFQEKLARQISLDHTPSSKRSSSSRQRANVSFSPDLSNSDEEDEDYNEREGGAGGEDIDDAMNRLRLEEEEYDDGDRTRGGVYQNDSSSDDDPLKHVRGSFKYKQDVEQETQ